MASDEFISILPGLGHTGSEPFDDHHGWYRSFRGPAGSIKYHAKWKGWTLETHHLFPKPLREAVYLLLLCEKRCHRDPNKLLVPTTSPIIANRKISARLGKYYISSLPKYVLIHIMEFMVIP